VLAPSRRALLLAGVVGFVPSLTRCAPPDLDVRFYSVRSGRVGANLVVRATFTVLVATDKASNPFALATVFDRNQRIVYQNALDLMLMPGATCLCIELLIPLAEAPAAGEALTLRVVVGDVFASVGIVDSGMAAGTCTTTCEGG
jgi:hypothetical protein